jgi:hypothetical protein
MTIAEIIAQCGKETKMPFLIIGGVAIVAHGYQRDTLDLDYLTRQSDRAAWRDALKALGYGIAHEHEHFDQFASTRGWMDLDLMYVNERTFDTMFSASEVKEMGSVSGRFPSLEHLIALKLHVLKQNIPHRMLGDMDDVINLLLVNRVDLRQDKWQQLFMKYGSLELYEKVLRATAP